MAQTPRIRFPERQQSPVTALGRRVGLAVMLVLAMVLIVWFDRSGYRDNAHPTRELSLLDSFYYTTVTITTTGYGDIAPVDERARLINALVVTPLRILFLVLLVGTTLEVLASQGREQWRALRWRRHMKNHVIVVGFGTKGRAAVDTLTSNGVDASEIVVIDAQSGAAADAADAGLTCVIGDATRRDVLIRASAAAARQFIVTTDRDDSAVLATLTVRQLNPDATIVVAVREEENVALVRQSGADAVVVSSEAVGRLLGLSTVSPDLGRVMEDLLSYGEGLEVAERDVLAAEVGKSPQNCKDQVIAVIRDGRLHHYFEPIVTQLARGDRLIVVRSARDLPWAERPGASERS